MRRAIATRFPGAAERALGVPPRSRRRRMRVLSRRTERLSGEGSVPLVSRQQGGSHGVRIGINGFGRIAAYF